MRTSNIKLKRTSPDEMFTIVRDFWSTHRGVLQGETHEGHCFFVIPRYVALVRASPDAIDNFFSYIAPGSRRAPAMRILLQAASGSQAVLRCAMARGWIAGVTVPPADASVRWDLVDALVAQWQFVGCFSLPERIVAHCLAHDRYHRCFENEIEARRDALGAVNIPRLIAVHESTPAGWIEELVVGDRHARRDPRFFQIAQEQIGALYAKTIRTAALDDYLHSLRATATERYSSTHPVMQKLSILLAGLDRASAALENPKLHLCRTHGDLAWNQIIVNKDNVHVIDWSESEMTSVCHDLVYSAIFRQGWITFDQEIDIPDLDLLRQVVGTYDSNIEPRSQVALVLVEVAVKQYVDYVDKRGTYKTWLRIADCFISGVDLDMIGTPDSHLRGAAE